jgi:beta-1,4-mannosyltransferase
MKVFMMPAQSPRLANKYIDVTVEGLNAVGVEVRSLPFIPSAKGAQAVHLHWLEDVFSFGRVASNPLLSRARAKQILAVIRKVRSGGGNLVWTVHNLQPHSNLEGEAEAAYRDFCRAVLAELDVFVSLTQAGVTEARRAYPSLGGVPYVVSRHPHYRGTVLESSKRSSLRAALGVADTEIVLSCIGRVTPNKGVLEAARAFCRLSALDLRLLVVGPFHEQCKRELAALAETDTRILLRDEALSDEEVADFHAAADAVVFNGTKNLNSGSLFMALSLNKPVLAPDTAVNSETASLVGEEWMLLFQTPLDAAELGQQVERLRGAIRASECDLRPFDPVSSARALRRAYSGAYEIRPNEG